MHRAAHIIAYCPTSRVITDAPNRCSGNCSNCQHGVMISGGRFRTTGFLPRCDRFFSGLFQLLRLGAVAFYELPGLEREMSPTRRRYSSEHSSQNRNATRRKLPRTQSSGHLFGAIAFTLRTNQNTEECFCPHEFRSHNYRCHQGSAGPALAKLTPDAQPYRCRYGYAIPRTRPFPGGPIGVGAQQRHSSRACVASGRAGGFRSIGD